MPSGENLLGFFGVLISILITAGFLAYHAMWLTMSQCAVAYGGCPYLTPDQMTYQTTLYGLGLLFLVAFDLAVGLSVALAFLAATRSDIAESTRRSLVMFAAIFLGVWLLVGTFWVPSLVSVIRYHY